MQVLMCHRIISILILRTDLDHVLNNSSAINPRLSLDSPGIQFLDDDTPSDKDDEDDSNNDPSVARARHREEEFMAKQFENPDMQQVKVLLANPEKYR